LEQLGPDGAHGADSSSAALRAAPALTFEITQRAA
jgi:hypothetical protein